MIIEPLRTMPAELVTPLVEDLDRLDRAGFHLYPHLGVGEGECLSLRRLARDFENFPIVDEVVGIVKRHENEWSESRFGIVQPITSVVDDLRNPQEALAYFASVLRRREQLFDKIQQMLGSKRFQLRLGNLDPFELSLDGELQLGVNRFYLMGGSRYNGGIKVYLGFVDVDYEGRDTLIVNSVQDERGIAWMDESGNLFEVDRDDNGEVIGCDNPIIYDGSQARKVQTITSKDQRRIRGFMKRDREQREDPYETETPGLEELMIYTSLEVFVRAGILDPNAKVIIPRPEVTAWGGLNESYFDCCNGTGIARNKTIALALAKNLSPTRLNRLRQRFSPCSSFETNYDETFQLADILVFVTREKLEDRREQPEILLDLPRRRRVKLGRFLAEALLQEIPDDLKPTERELDSYDFFGKYFPIDVAKFRRFLLNMATRTPAYMRTFHAYRTAFSDIPAEDLGYGRGILRRSLLELPFAPGTNIIAL